MSGIVFDAMSGVKMLTNLYLAINCPASTFEASIQQYFFRKYKDYKKNRCTEDISIYLKQNSAIK